MFGFGKRTKEDFAEGSPLRDLYELAGTDKSLLKKIEEWEKKWVVEYGIEDDISIVLQKTQDPDQITDILVKREEGAMLFIGKKLAEDCTSSVKNGKKHAYRIQALRKIKYEADPTK